MKLPENVTMTINGEYKIFPIIQGKKIKFGYWVGAVEVVVDGYQNEDGWEYITEYFPAFQLKSGRIVYVDSPFGSLAESFMVFSLKGKMFDIKWGFYPDDFPEEWKHCVATPVTVSEGIATVEPDELPF